MRQKITLSFVVETGDTPIPLLFETGHEEVLGKVFELVQKACPEPNAIEGYIRVENV